MQYLILRTIKYGDEKLQKTSQKKIKKTSLNGEIFHVCGSETSISLKWHFSMMNVWNQHNCSKNPFCSLFAEVEKQF